MLPGSSLHKVSFPDGKGNGYTDKETNSDMQTFTSHIPGGWGGEVGATLKHPVNAIYALKYSAWHKFDQN